MKTHLCLVAFALAAAILVAPSARAFQIAFRPEASWILGRWNCLVRMSHTHERERMIMTWRYEPVGACVDNCVGGGQQTPTGRLGSQPIFWHSGNASILTFRSAVNGQWRYTEVYRRGDNEMRNDSAGFPSLETARGRERWPMLACTRDGSPAAGARSPRWR
jgi:hypothetical protein